MNPLDRSFFFKPFRKKLAGAFGEEQAERIWNAAGEHALRLRQEHPDLGRDSRMLILPAAALYLADTQTLPLMREHAAALGRGIGKAVHAVTSIPGVSKLLWRNMSALMRTMSRPEKGYSRMIVSETAELVGVDILACPLHQAAIELGAPEAASVVCAMDKAYMTGFKHIEYTRTTALGEGDLCCDYRLRYDKKKK